MRERDMRVAAAYVALSWLLIQIAETVLPAFGFGVRTVRGVIIALVVGFLPAVVLAWAFELTPEGRASGYASPRN